MMWLIDMDPVIRIVDVCAEIGSIAESNSQYSIGLQRAIAKTGKQIEQLTVGELLILHRKYNHWFNENTAP